jgi:hypothetical protein
VSAYRTPPAGRQVEPRVIARLDWSRQLVMALLDAAAAGALGWAILGGWSPVIALAALPFLLDAVRRVQAFTIGAELRLTGEGIEFRYPASRSLLSFWHRQEGTVPWSAIEGVEIPQPRVAGVSSHPLALLTTAGTRTIPAGLLVPSARAVQTAILDYAHALFEAPERDALALVQFCRHRFARPLRISERDPWAGVASLCVTLVLPAALLMWWAPAAWPLWIALTSAGSAAVLSSVVARWRSIELGPRGVLLVRRSGREVLLPWEEIDYARRRVTNGRTLAVELRTRAGKHLTVVGRFDRSLDEVAELIDPPVARLRASLTDIAQGTPLEEAARRAGLPPVH